MLDKKKKPVKFSVFEGMILLVGVALTYFGFNIVGHLYSIDMKISWEMMTTVFEWLTLLVLFILLSMGVDANRRQLEEIKILKEIMKDSMNETKLMKKEVSLMQGKKVSIKKRSTKSKK